MLRTALLSFYICALGYMTVWSQDDSKTRRDFGLLGAVQTVKTVSTVLSEKPEDLIIKNSSQTFNTSGYLIESTFELVGTKMSLSCKFVYNEKNQILEEIKNNGDGAFTSYKNIYDEKGYVTEQKTFNADGAPIMVIVFVYNEKMLVILSENHTDPVKNPDFINGRITYRHNAQNKVFEIVEDKQDYELVSKFSYNAKGFVSEEHYTTTKAESEESENFSLYKTYNEEGKLIGIVRKDKEGKITGQESFVYDHLERMTYHNELNSMGKIIGYTQYSGFDENDNWLNSTRYEGKKIISTEVREITYYE